MKAILLFPKSYSLSKSIEEKLVEENIETSYIDYRGYVSSFDIKANIQIYRFPYSIREKWERYYFQKINKWYISQFKKYDPNLVFVYNNEMLLPSTMEWLRKKEIKVFFFLGDNPLYSHTSPYNLTILEYAQAVFVPDTFWLHQLNKMGLDRVYQLILPLPYHSYFPVENIDPMIRSQLQTDILYVGACYKSSWGYKKAKFLSFFVNNNLQIHGNNAWKRWFSFFPELENYFFEKKNHIPLNRLNLMYNCTKIIPIDGNPGIFNGMHIRISEALAAGALPIMEYNSDMDHIFNVVESHPVIKDYREIPKVIEYYLQNETERKETVNNLIESFDNHQNMNIIKNILN